ncbi:MAG TPA: hypothetical protein PLB97_04480, partial [Accumulibacter sp.]|nr:hypothetical protein [Accumulibacter sp.]
AEADSAASTGVLLLAWSDFCRDIEKTRFKLPKIAHPGRAVNSCATTPDKSICCQQPRNVC